MDVSKAKFSYLIGIDEAGRGPIAGPVAVGVFCVKSPEVLAEFTGVKDSKQLSEKQREEWFKKINEKMKEGKIIYSVSFSQPYVIDRWGIVWAVKSAIKRSLIRVEATGINPSESHVLLDGLLKAPRRYKRQQTIIDGDAKEPIIALASICAKVLRDRRMKKIAKRFPGYGFEQHKGYGTDEHYEALDRYGVSEIHRRSYLNPYFERRDVKDSVPRI